MIQSTTLEALRDTFRSRLGMASQTLLVNDALTSFLSDAQQQIWEQFDWPQLITMGTITTDPAQAAPALYDYPVDCDPRRIITHEVAALDNTVMFRMEEGIDWGHRSQPTLTGIPRRYERFGQFEVWPAPDRAYTVRFKYVRNLKKFSTERDTTDLEPNLILLHSLYNAKSHWRHPDAQIYADQYKARMTQIRAGAISKRRYSRTPSYDPPPLPRQV